MSVKELTNKILYLISIVFNVTFMCTKEYMFMFFGGIFLIAASIMLIVNNKNKKD